MVKSAPFFAIRAQLMANNSNLGAAKAAKNDEFYTQYADIQKEINAYLEYNPNTFRDKTVLLPCDDPEWSNFTRFFAQNFERLGLKRLISTSYAVESKKYKNYEPTLFEMDADHVTAWSKSGATDIENCQMLCKTHNRAKGNR